MNHAAGRCRWLTEPIEFSRDANDVHFRLPRSELHSKMWRITHRRLFFFVLKYQRLDVKYVQLCFLALLCQSTCERESDPATAVQELNISFRRSVSRSHFARPCFCAPSSAFDAGV